MQYMTPNLRDKISRTLQGGRRGISPLSGNSNGNLGTIIPEWAECIFIEVRATSYSSEARLRLYTVPAIDASKQLCDLYADYTVQGAGANRAFITLYRPKNGWSSVGWQTNNSGGGFGYYIAWVE